MYRWLASGVVAFALLATAYWAFFGGGRGDREPLAERLEGITVVHLRGPPRAKGRAHGEALRVRIRKELDRVLPASPGLREFVLRTCGERLLAFLPAEYREEIEGIAEGAGISFDEAFFLDTRFELAAHGLAAGEVDFALEGAVGPGPEAGCLFAEGAASDFVVLVHEDRDPPVVLVARPGMAGGFLGISGNVAAAMRPIREGIPPPLHGLVWTLLLRRLLEAPPVGESEPPAEGTGPVSVAMALPDGTAGTMSLAAWGAAWYASSGPGSLTTDEPPLPWTEGRGRGVPRLPRDAKGGARIAEEAARLLGGALPPGRMLVSLRGGEVSLLTVSNRDGRRVARLD